MNFTSLGSSDTTMHEEGFQSRIVQKTLSSSTLSALTRPCSTAFVLIGRRTTSAI
jgi:hypothetical protein